MSDEILIRSFIVWRFNIRLQSLNNSKISKSYISLSSLPMHTVYTVHIYRNKTWSQFEIMMRLKVSLFVRDFFTHVFNITSNYLFVSDWSRKHLFTITLENMKSWKLLKFVANIWFPWSRLLGQYQQYRCFGWLYVQIKSLAGEILELDEPLRSRILPKTRQ